MLRNFISKLPGFTTLSELPVSTSCNSRMFRTLSPPIQIDHRRKIHRNETSRSLYRRSYSFPSARSRTCSIERSRPSTPYQTREDSQSRSLSSRRDKPKKGKSNKLTEESTFQKKTEEEEEGEEIAKEGENECSNKDFYETYESSVKYEIEGSRPRKSQSQIDFYVLEHADTRENDNSYLQPSKLKPFGSQNDYLHYIPRLHAELAKKNKDIESESLNKVTKNQRTDSVQKREYSTKSFQRPSGTASLIEDLPPFQISKVPKHILPKASSTQLSMPKYEEKSDSTKTNFYQYHYDADSITKSLAEELPVRNRAVTPPPKPAYSETVIAQENFLSKITKDIYGEHVSERTIPPLKKTMSDRNIDSSKPEMNTMWKFGLQPTKNSKRYFIQTESTLLNKRKNIDTKKCLSSKTLSQNEGRSDKRYEKKRSKKTKEQISYEPEPCDKTESVEKCFLPSKIRLKPPICTPRPPPCPLPEPCERADDNVVFKYKPLPIIKTNDSCQCINPYVPTENPKLKRLTFHSPDPVKDCSEEKPCTTPRADDDLLELPKRLKPYVAKDCICVEPRPLVDVPLKRLKKVCIPPEVCRPPRVCPEPEPCVRADDNLLDKPKKLQKMVPVLCPCIIEPPQFVMPKMKRLNLKVPEPPRNCPTQCVCDVDCPRADDTRLHLPKKLPKLTAGDCPCIEPTLEDVKPLKRLVCVDEPEECYQVDPCIETPRADMGCWEYYVTKDKNVEQKTKKGVNYNSERKYNTSSRSYRFPSTKDFTKLDDSVWKEPLEKGHKVKSVKKTIGSSPPASNLWDQFPQTEFSSVHGTKTDTANILPKSPIQWPSFRSLSSRAENVYEKTVGQKSSNEQQMKQKSEYCPKPKDCDKLKKCPLYAQRTCPTARDPCNKACKHIPPQVDCQQKKPPYPAFSDLLNETISPFAGSAECRCNQREFDYHLEEKKITVPSKFKKKDKKCYSTLAPSENFSRSEEREKQVHRSNIENTQGAQDQKKQSETTRLDMNPTGFCSRRKHVHTDHCISENSSNSTCYRSSINEKATPKRILKPQTASIVQSYQTHTRYKTPAVENIKVDLKDKKPVKKTRTIQKDGQTVKVECESSITYCPKIKLPQCQPLTKRTKCNKIFKVECQKQQAPFKAFSDCLDEELAENIAECPLEREKIRHLQPDYIHSFQRSKLVKPVPPRVGKLDLTAEDDCVRRRLCLQKAGVSQSCACFNKPIKPLKAKDIPKLREELKNQDDEKHIYHTQTARNCKRKFCTCAFNPLNIQKRSACSCLRSNKDTREQELHTRSEVNIRRSYHLLCKTKERYLEEELDENKDTSLYRAKDFEDKSKMKLGSVQWRVDNFQKWHRLNKLNNHSTSLKKFHSCFDLLKDNQRMFSTSASNTVSFHTIEDDILCRHISTSNSKCIPRKPFDPRKIKGDDKSANKYRETKTSKFGSINAVPESDYTTDQFNTSSKISERFISEPFPNIGVVDYNLGREYIRQKYGVKNEGITLDCDTFGKGLRHQGVMFKMTEVQDKGEDCKEKIKETEECEKLVEEVVKQCSPRLEDPKEVKTNEVITKEIEDLDKKTEECCKQIEEMYNNTKDICSKIKQECNEVKKEEDVCKRVQEAECPRVEEVCQKPKPTLRKISDEVKCLETNKPCKQRMIYKGCMSKQHNIKKSYSECDLSLTKELRPKKQTLSLDRNRKCESSKSSRTIPSCTSPQQKDSVWRKIINYFKARPGCPPPDEWKKKALRAKAEKAAKAAGLVVCDPKDLKMLKSSCSSAEMPKVITPPCNIKTGKERDDPCTSSKKVTLDVFQKRNFTTTAISSLPSACTFLDPLYIGQYLNKAIITVPLDFSNVNLTGSCRFPKILGCFCNFPLQKCNPDFLKYSPILPLGSKRHYSKHPNKKILKKCDKTKEKCKKNKNLKYFQDDQEDFNDNINKKDSIDCFDKQKQIVDNNVQRSLSLCKYSNHSLQRRNSLADTIFNEDATELTDYNKAKTFAAFQELLNKFDSYSDINIEELEKLKTQNMLRELDKLLDESGQSEKKKDK